MNIAAIEYGREKGKNESYAGEEKNQENLGIRLRTTRHIGATRRK